MRAGGSVLRQRPVVAGLATVLLFAVVAAGAGALRSRSESSSAVDPSWLVAVVAAVALVGFVLLVVWIVWSGWLPTGAGRVVRSGGQWRAVLVVVVVLGGLTVGVLLSRGLVLEGDRAQPAPAGQPAPWESAGRARETRADGWVVVALAGTMLAGLGAAWLIRRRRSSSLADQPAAIDDDLVARAAWDSLDAVLAEPDPRAAVLKAYLHMEHVFARAGVAREPWETPFEYLDRVFGSLGAPRPVAITIADLYEYSKFSNHVVGVEMRDAAVAALRSLCAALEGAS